MNKLATFSSHLLLGALVFGFVASSLEALPAFETIRTTSLAQKRAAFLNTKSGRAWLHIHHGFECQNDVVKFDDKKLTSLDETNNFGVVQKAMNGYGSYTCGKYEFKNAQPTRAGRALASALRKLRIVPERNLTESPFTELYNNNVPMLWQLKTADEFRFYVSQIGKRLTSLGVLGNQKPILAVMIDNDPFLTSLTEHDIEVAGRIFSFVRLEGDKDVKDFFYKRWETCIKEIKNAEKESDSYDKIYNTLAERLHQRFQSFTKDFELDSISHELVLTAIGVISAAYLVSPYRARSLSAFTDLLNWTKDTRVISALAGYLTSGKDTVTGVVNWTSETLGSFLVTG